MHRGSRGLLDRPRGNTVLPQGREPRRHVGERRHRDELRRHLNLQFVVDCRLVCGLVAALHQFCDEHLRRHASQEAPCVAGVVDLTPGRSTRTRRGEELPIYMGRGEEYKYSEPGREDGTSL